MLNDQLRCGALSIWLFSTLSLPATPASEVSLSRTTKSKEIWRKSHLWQKKQSYWSKNCLMWAFQSIVISDSWWLGWQPGPLSFSTLTSTSGTTSSSRDTNMCPQAPRKRPRTFLQSRSSLDLIMTPRHRTVQQDPNLYTVHVFERSLRAIVIYVQKFCSNNHSAWQRFSFQMKFCERLQWWKG